MSAVTIVNVGYRSTNFRVVSAGRSRPLVDLGWSGMSAAPLRGHARPYALPAPMEASHV